MADIIFIAVLILFAYLGAKKGLIKTLVGIASTVLSVILSMLLYNPISKILYDSSLGDSVKEYVREFLTGKAEGAAKLLITDAAVETASVLVMNIISFVVVIIASKILIILLSKILNIAAKFPIIKQANKLLGMIAGIISGILVCYIAVGVIMTLSSEGNAFVIKESIENSYLAIKLCDKNIIYGILWSLLK